MDLDEQRMMHDLEETLRAVHDNMFMVDIAKQVLSDDREETLRRIKEWRRRVGIGSMDGTTSQYEQDLALLPPEELMSILKKQVSLREEWEEIRKKKKKRE
jgi:hypothetical protein